MKKAIISIFLILICYLGYGQFPITQNLGSASTLVQVPANGGLRAGLIPRAFLDTTEANTTYLKYYDGALIKTTTPIQAIWWRYLDSVKWVQILPAGGSSGQRSWLDGGNYSVLADVNDNAVMGTLLGNGIKLTTNSVTRVILPKTGLARASGGAYKYMLFDTTNKTWAYGDGGSTPVISDSAWSLTGNSGTSPGTKFIGTTDNVGLMFKVNNTQAGYLQPSTANTSFGLSSLISNTTGNGISAFGDNALNHNTSGTNNTAVGQAAMYQAINSNSNSAFGLSSMQENTSGDGNSGFGYRSLYSDTSGAYNSSIGFNSLYGVRNGSYNIGVGSYSGNYATTQSQRLFINSIDRTNISGDTTKSIIYGAQDATAANQRLYLNSQVYLPYAASGVGTKALRINPGTGIITYADTTVASSGTVSSIATNAGTGITGGTITTTGTLALDTAYVVLTKYKAGQTYLPLAGAAYTTTTGDGLALTTSTLTTGNLMKLTNTSTVNNGAGLLSIVSSGANSTASKTTSGLVINVSNTGTTSTSYGADISVTGATTNRPLRVIGGTSGVIFQEQSGGYFGLYSSNVTPGSSNYGIILQSSSTYLNSPTDTYIGATGSNYLYFATGTMQARNTLSVNSNNAYDLGASGTAWRSGYFGTSAQVPLIIGGTGTTSTLTLKTTTGVGTTNADMIFQVGNNGATEAMRILNSGSVGIGTSSPAATLHIVGSEKVTGAHIDNYVEIPDADYTILSTDYIISAALWTADHTITLPGSPVTGRRLRFVVGQALGNILFNTNITYNDGTVIASGLVAFGLSSTAVAKAYSGELIWTGTVWQVIDTGTN